MEEIQFEGKTIITVEGNGSYDNDCKKCYFNSESFCFSHKLPVHCMGKNIYFVEKKEKE